MYISSQLQTYISNQYYGIFHAVTLHLVYAMPYSNLRYTRVLTNYHMICIKLEYG